MFGDIVTQQIMKYKYLGDILDGEGLAASIDSSIEERLPKIKTAMFECKTLMEDYRMQAIGGTSGALDLWNAVIIPTILFNSSTWTELRKKTIAKLEDLQLSHLRLILAMPAVGTPKAALLAETGILSMDHRVLLEKLNFDVTLKAREDTLSGKIYKIQSHMEWPGLAREDTDICKMVGLDNINTTEVTKAEVKKAVWDSHIKRVKEELLKLSKVRYMVDNDLGKPAKYLHEMSLVEARVMFRVRSNMMWLKDEMRNKYRGDLTCEACDEGCDEDQDHVRVCKGYSYIRTNMYLGNNTSQIFPA